MTGQLRDALRELADQADEVAPPATPAPQDLWSRGRRARRRRTAGTVLVAGVLVALLGAVAPLAGVGLPTAPGPASYDESDLAVPDRIWAPSSWAPTADEDHPPGPLAVVAAGGRRAPWLFTTRGRWFGVSAVDQTYRWLSLPGQAASEEAQEVALSPDGTRLAYYLGGAPGARHPQSDVVGFAVLDLVTGEVAERRIHARFGLRPGVLTWSGDSRWLVNSQAKYLRMQGASARAAFDAWNPGTGDLRPLHGLDDLEGVGPSPAGVATWRGRHLVEVDPSSGHSVERAVDWWWEDDAAADEPVFNRRGSYVAWHDGRRKAGGTFPAVYVASVGADDALGRPMLLKTRWMPGEVLGWLDETTVLVEVGRYPDAQATEYEHRIVGFDVRTGKAVAAIGRPSDYDDVHQVQLATDLLHGTLAEGRRPGMDLPLVPVAAAVLLLGGLAAVALLGRRAGRRRREERLGDDGVRG